MTTAITHFQRFRPLYAIGVLSAVCLSGAHLLGDPKTLDWPTWIQAVGSVAAIFVAVWVSTDQARLQLDRDDKAARADVIGTLCSLQGEVEMTLLYIASEGAEFLAHDKPGEPILFTLPLPEYPYPIFDALIPKLGAITDPDMQRQIIHAYAKAKSLAMTISQHNQLVDEYEAMRAQNIAMKPHDVPLNLQPYRDRLAGYSDTARSSVTEVQAELTLLREALMRKQIVVASPGFP